jgi:hypothetical protein
MTYSFDVDDDTVWSPYNQLGELYVGMLGAVANVLKLPTGLETDGGEFYDIDLPAFGILVGGMLVLRAGSDHLYLKMLLDGILPLSVAMLYSGGGALTPATSRERDLLAEIRAMYLPMAR